ncbi:hypothetical protein BOX15_Mlig031712g5 [Macrostomum lignano]|uniref:Glycosyltransferase family 92 protein n=1 Tax=Macrostomum lignano TaxID=282301 RepID=A0A267G1G0_9PLAT|nr:hypothetical protein BOX15_Mlig031712g5 [Macrostomum lignano]
MISLKCRRYLVIAICLLCTAACYVFYKWMDFDANPIRHYLAYDYYFGSPLMSSSYSQVNVSSSVHTATEASSPSPQTVFSLVGKPVLVLFSARFDFQLGLIVLVGYFNNRLSKQPPRVTCRLSSLKSSTNLDARPWQQAVGYSMHEGHYMPYDGVLYFCPVVPTESSYLVEVNGVDVSNRASGKIKLPVHVAESSKPADKVAACITALRYLPSEESENQFIMRLVEFIEVNRLLGVEHFYFYNMSLPSKISAVMKHYIGIGWITVTPWSLAEGIDLDKDIHYYGQMVILNDCLYSARDRYRLLTFIDIDEMLVPTNSKGEAINLVKAAQLHSLDDRGGNCALGFRHGVFPPSPKQEKSGEIKMPTSLIGCKIVSLLRRRRIKSILPFTERSKLLVVARQIKEIGIHFVWNSWQSCQTKQLSPISEGLLHHYRHWAAGEMIEDQSMKSLQRDIETALIGARDRLKHLFGIDLCA